MTYLDYRTSNGIVPAAAGNCDAEFTNMVKVCGLGALSVVLGASYGLLDSYFTKDDFSGYRSVYGPLAGFTSTCGAAIYSWYSCWKNLPADQQEQQVNEATGLLANV